MNKIQFRTKDYVIARNRTRTVRTKLRRNDNLTLDTVFTFSCWFPGQLFYSYRTSTKSYFRWDQIRFINFVVELPEWDCMSAWQILNRIWINSKGPMRNIGWSNTVCSWHSFQHICQNNWSCCLFNLHNVYLSHQQWSRRRSDIINGTNSRIR